MRVQYIGMFDEVVVPEIDPGRGIAKGEPLEVGDELGARLLEQATNWELVGVPASLKPTRQSSPAAAADTAGNAPTEG